MKKAIRFSLTLTAVLLLFSACAEVLPPDTAPGGTAADTDGQTGQASDATDGTKTDAVTDATTDAATADTTETTEEETDVNYDGKTGMTAQIEELKQLTQTLDASPYAVPAATDGFFLSGPVGADKDRMEREVLYPVPDDVACAKVIRFADYGMDEGNTGEQNYAAFTRAMTAFSGVDGLKKAVFPSGKIRLSRTLPLGGYRDLYLVGNCTTVVEEAWQSVTYARDCDGIHVNDLSFEYLYSPVVWGIIEGFDVGTGVITVAVDKSFDMTNPIYGLVGGGTRSLPGYYELTPGDGGDFRILPDKTVRYAARDLCRLDSAERNTVDVLFSEGALGTEPTVGDRVNLVFCQYDACAFNFTFCKNVFIEQVSVTETPGMALVITYSENAFINRFSVYPDRNRGLTLATSADGIHTINLSGSFNLSNCSLVGTQDDCLNVCATYDLVSWVSGNVLTYTPVGEANGIKAGCVIEVYDPSTWACCGSYTVKATDGTRLTLDRDADAGIGAGFVIGNVTGATRLTLDNCLFSSSMGRGGLIQSRDTRITRCSFTDLMYPALRVHAVNDEFKEAIVPADITVRDCKFINDNLFPFYDSMIEVMAYDKATGASTVGAIKGVCIENNYFAHSAGNAISLKGVGGATVRHNLICDMLNRPLYNCRVTVAGMMANAAVGISYTENTCVSDNCIYSPKVYGPYADVLCDPDTAGGVTVGDNLSLIEARGVFNSLYMDFSAAQGTGNFTYMKRNARGQLKPLTWQEGDGRWQADGTYTMIARDFMHPDSQDAALVYTVPETGAWTYFYSVQPVDSRSDGVGVAVWVNGEPVVAGDNGYVYVGPVSLREETLLLELSQGDEVTFLLNKWGNNSFDACNVKVYARLD